MTIRLAIAFVLAIVLHGNNCLGKDQAHLLALEDIVRPWADDKIVDPGVIVIQENGIYKGTIEIDNIINQKEDNHWIIVSKRWVKPRGGYPRCFELHFLVPNSPEAARLRIGDTVTLRGRYARRGYRNSGYLDVCSIEQAIFEDVELVKQ